MSDTKRIDWEAVKSRLAKHQQAPETASGADEARMREAFHRRGELLARRRSRGAGEERMLCVQTFYLGERFFGIELSQIREIVPLRQFTRVPGAPAEVMGILNLRGDVRLILDFSHIAGLGRAAPGALGYVLLVRLQEADVGLQADRLGRTLTLRETEFVRAQDHAGGLIRGFSADRLALLDVQAILARAGVSTGSQN